LLDRRQLDLEPVEVLGAMLRGLSIDTHPKAALDLSRLSELKTLSANWSNVSHNFDHAPPLEQLRLGAYPERTLEALNDQTALRELVLDDRPRVTSLQGLGCWQTLRNLAVQGASALQDFEGLWGGSHLQSLNLLKCQKLQRVDFIEAMGALLHLNISECGEVESLAPLSHALGLEKLELYGSTRIVDLDLRPLLALDRLRMLRIKSKKEYVPTVEDVKRGLDLEGRPPSMRRVLGRFRPVSHALSQALRTGVMWNAITGGGE
jgi:internalin A